MNAHKHLMPLEISFKHCDPAGIVFYPRYVEMLNDVVEHWFQHALGCSFAQLHLERALAIPVADLHCGFIAPSRLGDALEAELQVQRLGRSSFTVVITLRHRQQPANPRLAAELTAVFVDMGTLRPVEIPADLRAAMEAGNGQRPRANAAA